MPLTNFKFTTPEGLNRRLTFSELPTWSLLASKLYALYGISPDSVGVSYVDNDNDEITVSSDEELQDFYNMSHQVGQVIKFAVVDLRSSHNDAGKPLEFPSLSRNPFDTDAFEFVGEWERFPSVTEAKSGPHAFVEVLSSNNSVGQDRLHEIDTDTESDHFTEQPPLLNKGKGRSLSFGAASITSVWGEEVSHKHPIHYDLNSRGDGEDKDNNFDDPSAHIQVAAQSTTKVQTKDTDDNRNTKEIPGPSEAVEAEDPPLPSLDEFPASTAPASLFHDLASLVHDVTQVVLSHPELSEGLRSIGRNVSNGTYWTTHREALSKVVNGMSNPPSTEEERQAEEDAAARRLTDVVGNFFRSLSQVPVDTEDTRASNINEDRSGGENLPDASPAWPGWGFPGRRSRFYGPWGPMPGLRGPRPFPPFPRHFPRGPFPPHGPHAWPGPHRPPPFHHGPHPMPPPPHAPPGPPPPRYASPPTPSAQPPPETACPPPPPSVPLPNESLGSMHRRQSYNGPFVPFLSVSGDQSRSQPSKPNAQEMREEVETAKRMYKAKKEHYRQERERRRREKLGHRPNVFRHSTIAQAEIPRGMYPEFERVDVPRRSHTHLGHEPSRHLDRNDLMTRAMGRIAKKLSDMGFSENACPTLPEKIKAQMPTNGVISKEAEDDVVTTLLEELLATAPNVASSSGQRDIDMEEVWH